MTTATPTFDAVLHSIYRAVGVDEAWDDAVRHIAQHLGASIGMLVVAGKGQRDQSFYAAWNHCEEVARAYSDIWWEHDVLLKVAVSRGMFVAGTIARGSDILPVAELRKTAYYRDFMRSMPAEACLACVLSDGSDPLLAPPMHLSLFRAPGQVDFSVDELGALSALYPHLHRAFNLHWHLRQLNDQLALFQQSLDGLDFGVVFIDPAQRVCHVNNCARQLASDSNLARLLGPLPERVPTGGPLAELLQAGALGQGGALKLDSGSHRLLALALALTKPRHSVGGDIRVSVMLMLIDPTQKPGAALDFLVHAFGLSKAEARVLPLLLADLTPAEMAQRLGIKIATVRSQLSAIYARTGTARQQELIRLLGTLPPVRQSVAGTGSPCIDPKIAASSAT